MLYNKEQGKVGLQSWEISLHWEGFPSFFLRIFPLSWVDAGWNLNSSMSLTLPLCWQCCQSCTGAPKNPCRNPRARNTPRSIWGCSTHDTSGVEGRRRIKVFREDWAAWAVSVCFSSCGTKDRLSLAPGPLSQVFSEHLGEQTVAVGVFRKGTWGFYNTSFDSPNQIPSPNQQSVKLVLCFEAQNK